MGNLLTERGRDVQSDDGGHFRLRMMCLPLKCEDIPLSQRSGEFMKDVVNSIETFVAQNKGSSAQWTDRRTQCLTWSFLDLDEGGQADSKRPFHPFCSEIVSWGNF